MNTPQIFSHDGIREIITLDDINKWLDTGKKICEVCSHINCLCHASGSECYVGEK